MRRLRNRRFATDPSSKALGKSLGFRKCLVVDCLRRNEVDSIEILNQPAAVAGGFIWEIPDEDDILIIGLFRTAITVIEAGNAQAWRLTEHE